MGRMPVKQGLCLIFMLCLAGRAAADGVIIQSLDNSGRMAFTCSTNTTHQVMGYRIEWASSVMGPWTNFSSLHTLDAIPPLSSGTGTVTVLCPAFYRVVAVMTNAAVVMPRALRNPCGMDCLFRHDEVPLREWVNGIGFDIASVQTEYEILFQRKDELG